MQNSFEKQVQQKMDELKFVPTEPVWQNIEKQIRTKKDRRRFILWLPLLVLLLGGGVWWLSRYNQKSENTIAAEQKNTFREKQNASPVQNNLTKIRTGTDASVTSMQLEEKEKPVKTTIQMTVSSINPSASLKAKNHKAVFNHNISPAITVVEKQTNSKEILTNNTEKSTEATTSQHETSVASAQTKVDAPLQPGTAEKDSSMQNKTAAIQSDIIKDSIQTETAQTVRTKKSGASAWQLGFVVNAGIAGIAKGFGSVSLNKSFDAAPSYSTGSGTTPQASAPTASPVKNNVAFSVGIIATKKINKRFSFSTGLQYRYYSTHMAVGQIRRQDSVMSGNLRISQFYLNSGTGFKNYHNSYHFISFPAMIDWQVFRKMPLYVQAGLSLQQLIRTNSLLFDGRNNIYYNDNSVFHKTQLFSAFSLSYKAFDAKKISLLLGPQLQYGLSNLEKSKSGKHLFSLGLSAQFLFQKK